MAVDPHHHRRRRTGERLDAVLVTIISAALRNKRTAAAIGATVLAASNWWSNYSGQKSAEQAARVAAFADHRCFVSNAVARIDANLASMAKDLAALKKKKGTP